jgi:hypothetical protein
MRGLTTIDLTAALTNVYNAALLAQRLSINHSINYSSGSQPGSIFSFSDSR